MASRDSTADAEPSTDRFRRSRRTVLLGTGAVTLLAGCGWFAPDDRLGSASYAELRVENRDGEGYELRVEADGDFIESAASRSVPSGDTVVFDELVPRLDYDHEFTLRMWLDGEHVHTETYRMVTFEWTFRITPEATIEEAFDDELRYA